MFGWFKKKQDNKILARQILKGIANNISTLPSAISDNKLTFVIVGSSNSQAIYNIFCKYDLEKYFCISQPCGIYIPMIEIYIKKEIDLQKLITLLKLKGLM